MTTTTFVRAGIVQVLLSDGRFRIESEASTIEELKAQLKDGSTTDVLVLDLILGRSSVAHGIDTIKALHAGYPDMAIVVLSVHDAPDVVYAALHAGAKGYVTKDSPPSALVDAIIQVSLGHRYIAPKLVEPLFLQASPGPNQAWHAELTPREYEVLMRLVEGQSVKAIAIDLDLSTKTVSTHKVRMMSKLGVANNADLIRLAIKHGMS